MGWCSGSYLAENIFKKIEQYLPNEVKYEIAKMIYDEFCDMDADCWDDDMQIMKYIKDAE